MEPFLGVVIPQNGREVEVAAPVASGEPVLTRFSLPPRSSALDTPQKATVYAIVHQRNKKEQLVAPGSDPSSSVRTAKYTAASSTTTRHTVGTLDSEKNDTQFDVDLSRLEGAGHKLLLYVRGNCPVHASVVASVPSNRPPQQQQMLGAQLPPTTHHPYDVSASSTLTNAQAPSHSLSPQIIQTLLPTVYLDGAVPRATDFPTSLRDVNIEAMQHLQNSTTPSRSPMTAAEGTHGLSHLHCINATPLTTMLPAPACIDGHYYTSGDSTCVPSLPDLWYIFKVSSSGRRSNTITANYGKEGDVPTTATAKFEALFGKGVLGSPIGAAFSLSSFDHLWHECVTTRVVRGGSSLSNTTLLPESNSSNTINRLAHIAPGTSIRLFKVRRLLTMLRRFCSPLISDAPPPLERSVSQASDQSANLAKSNWLDHKTATELMPMLHHDPGAFFRRGQKNKNKDSATSSGKPPLGASVSTDAVSSCETLTSLVFRGKCEARGFSFLCTEIALATLGGAQFTFEGHSAIAGLILTAGAVVTTIPAPGEHQSFTIELILLGSTGNDVISNITSAAEHFITTFPCELHSSERKVHSLDEMPAWQLCDVALSGRREPDTRDLGPLRTTFVTPHEGKRPIMMRRTSPVTDEPAASEADVESIISDVKAEHSASSIINTENDDSTIMVATTSSKKKKKNKVLNRLDDDARTKERSSPTPTVGPSSTIPAVACAPETRPIEQIPKNEPASKTAIEEAQRVCAALDASLQYAMAIENLFNTAVEFGAKEAVDLWAQNALPKVSGGHSLPQSASSSLRQRRSLHHSGTKQQASSTLRTCPLQSVEFVSNLAKIASGGSRNPHRVLAQLAGIPRFQQHTSTMLKAFEAHERQHALAKSLNPVTPSPAGSGKWAPHGRSTLEREQLKRRMDAARSSLERGDLPFSAPMSPLSSGPNTFPSTTPASFVAELTSTSIKSTSLRRSASLNSSSSSSYWQNLFPETSNVMNKGRGQPYAYTNDAIAMGNSAHVRQRKIVEMSHFAVKRTEEVVAATKVTRLLLHRLGVKVANVETEGSEAEDQDEVQEQHTDDEQFAPGFVTDESTNNEEESSAVTSRYYDSRSNSRSRHNSPNHDPWGHPISHHTDHNHVVRTTNAKANAKVGKVIGLCLAGAIGFGGVCVGGLMQGDDF